MQDLPADKGRAQAVRAVDPRHRPAQRAEHPLQGRPVGGLVSAGEGRKKGAAAFRRKIFQAGAGSKVKIINQLLAGVHIAAAAEAMALGIREGVDPEALYEVITNSAGNSWMFENRMAHVLAADYTPLSAVDIFVKDLGLVLDVARATKFPLPLSSTAHQMFMQASTAGYAKEDDSAVIKIFPGIELPKKNTE